MLATLRNLNKRLHQTFLNPFSKCNNEEFNDKQHSDFRQEYNILRIKHNLPVALPQLFGFCMKWEEITEQRIELVVEFIFLNGHL
ncbi:CLUMA_CG014883, isoform A [Clunio marinus]|uniref:CLUMA_CG014883, isoform A n=1 Tax=Clunio marinus TaxID=568069 RepID=A0A1J1IN58_9DIPT|nr:CLUMA_CG014883, isoform A [Clunio marinus]